MSSPSPQQVHVFVHNIVTFLPVACIDPVKTGLGVNLGVTHEYRNGRRDQALDGQAQERLGGGDFAGQDDGGGGQPGQYALGPVGPDRVQYAPPTGRWVWVSVVEWMRTFMPVEIWCGSMIN